MPRLSIEQVRAFYKSGKMTYAKAIDYLTLHHDMTQREAIRTIFAASY